MSILFRPAADRLGGFYVFLFWSQGLAFLCCLALRTPSGRLSLLISSIKAMSFIS
jgi:hypothetical protein